MKRNTSEPEKKSYGDVLRELADRLEESLLKPVDGTRSADRPAAKSIADIRVSITEHQLKVARSFNETYRSINRSLLDLTCRADPKMAAARNPPPVRSPSKSLDAVCCALEQIRVGNLDSAAAAEWVVEKANSLIDKKIAASVLTLASPGYQRNRGKYGKDSCNRRDFELDALDSHPAWADYCGLEEFCSRYFAAVLLAAKYELVDVRGRAEYMAQGLEEFLRRLGFYDNEVNGYSSLIRDEGAKAARVGWGY